MKRKNLIIMGMVVLLMWTLSGCKANRVNYQKTDTDADATQVTEEVASDTMTEPEFDGENTAPVSEETKAEILEESSVEKSVEVPDKEHPTEIPTQPTVANLGENEMPPAIRGD